MISVEHLTKCYGDFVAVDDLSFEIDEGHVYGFLGPNGAGKSTTMNIMTGCLSATSGCVLIDGHDIFEEPNSAKKLIGYLPEQPPLYMSETPLEYLRFVGQAKGLRGEELQRQIEEVIDQTKIQDIKGKRISALSKGYRQRVGIIYVISQEKFEALMEASRDDLRHTEVFTADFEQLTGIDVSLEGEDYALSCQKAEDEDEEGLWLYDEEQFNVNALQSAIEGLRSVSFTDEKAASDAKEEISLSLYLDNEYFPQIDIAFYRYDGSNCLCLVDGSPVSLVSRADVVELIEAVNAIVLS